MLLPSTHRALPWFQMIEEALKCLRACVLICPVFVTSLNFLDRVPKLALLIDLCESKWRGYANSIPERERMSFSYWVLA